MRWEQVVAIMAAVLYGTGAAANKESAIRQARALLVEVQDDCKNRVGTELDDA